MSPAKAFDPFGIFFDFYDRYAPYHPYGPFQDYIDTERERHELRQYRRRERYHERRRYQEERYRDFEEYKRDRFRKQGSVVPAPRVLRYETTVEPGTIIIFTNERKLHFVEADNFVYEYPIAVGKQGYEWSGVEKVSRIQHWPDWYPTEEMRIKDSRLPKVVRGGPRNPLGAVAIYLGDTLYRIHGTNDPGSIGTFASSGCIRMHNSHALHLASRVEVGDTVIVRLR
jgi:lipoprotein-anchoring transpeptidase ErfK/SrfK